MASSSGNLEIERRFLLAHAPDLDHPLFQRAEVSRITQTYLAVDGNARVRVRRIEKDGAVSYTRTAKRKVSAGVRDEVECEITETEYQLLKQLADPERRTVEKDRYTFDHSGKTFELDAIRSPRELWVLEVELESVESLEAELELPEGFPDLTEVTDTLSNDMIAKMS